MLVVEDATQGPNVTNYLKQFSNHTILSADDLMTFHTITDQLPDVILLAGGFSGPGSDYLRTQLKANSETSHIQLILLAGNDMETELFTTLVDPKPRIQMCFQNGELQEKLGSWLQYN